METSEIELIKMTKEDINNLSELVSENFEQEFIIPWKIPAIINQVIDFLNENKNTESAK